MTSHTLYLLHELRLARDVLRDATGPEGARDKTVIDGINAAVAQVLEDLFEGGECAAPERSRGTVEAVKAWEFTDEPHTVWRVPFVYLSGRPVLELATTMHRRALPALVGRPRPCRQSAAAWLAIDWLAWRPPTWPDRVLGRNGGATGMWIPTTWNELRPADRVRLRDGAIREVAEVASSFGGLIEVVFSDGHHVRTRGRPVRRRGQPQEMEAEVWREGSTTAPTVEVTGPPIPPGLIPMLIDLVDHPGDRREIELLEAHPERIRGVAVYRDEARRRDVYEFELANGQGVRAVSVADAARIARPLQRARAAIPDPRAPGASHIEVEMTVPAEVADAIRAGTRQSFSIGWSTAATCPLCAGGASCERAHLPVEVAPSPYASMPAERTSDIIARHAALTEARSLSMSFDSLVANTLPSSEDVAEMVTALEAAAVLRPRIVHAPLTVAEMIEGEAQREAARREEPPLVPRFMPPVSAEQTVRERVMLPPVVIHAEAVFTSDELRASVAAPVPYPATPPDPV